MSRADGGRGPAPPPDPAARPRRLVSLLGDEGRPPADAEARRDSPPGSSEHSSFHGIEPPVGDHDLARATRICAEITRDLLRDFAPALLLLPAAERRRVQALTAYTRTLFDFARDTSLEGERLAQINRWQFALEQALGGDPPGQPVFVLLAEEERNRSWHREGFDELASMARQRVSLGLPRNPEEAARSFRRLAAAIAQALTGAPLANETATRCAAILRAHSLLGWQERLWSDRPDLDIPAAEAGGERFRESVRRESAALRVELAAGLEPDRALAPFGPAARFLHATAVQIVARAERAAAADSPPRIPLTTRVRLLATARLASLARRS